MRFILSPVLTNIRSSCSRKSCKHLKKTIKRDLGSEEFNGDYSAKDFSYSKPKADKLESSRNPEKLSMRRKRRAKRKCVLKMTATVEASETSDSPISEICCNKEDAARIVSRGDEALEDLRSAKPLIKGNERPSGEDPKPRSILYKKLINGNYTCDICNSSFEQKSKIMRHITSKHSFHRPFKCSICSKAFKYKCDLKAHKLVHETVHSSLLHRCDKCDYGTKTKNNLKSHYIRKHTDDYKFSCEHCGKRFKMEWDLKFHVGTHGNSQHMCDICGRFYTSSYSLYKHRKVAHLNDYKYQCSVCNKRLLTQENLDNHMLQHSRTYSCKECAKVFASKRYLSTHMTTHTGVKPYPCHVCEKNFRTSHMRNTHLLTHSAERPHICDLCGQAFKRRYYMIEHRRKHPDAHLSSPPIPLGRNRGNSANVNTRESLAS